MQATFNHSVISTYLN